MLLTAVTFDLWETLLSDAADFGRERSYRRIGGTLSVLEQAGYSYEWQHAVDAYRNTLRRLGDLRSEGKDVTSREQVRRFLVSIDPELPDKIDNGTFESVNDRYSCLDADIQPEPMDGALAALQGARRLGLRIGLISNTGTTPGRVMAGILERHGLRDYFNVLTFSDEVELAKPSPQIFLNTLEELGAQPAETAHVGDHSKWDVIGAQRAGLRTIKLAHPREDDTGAEPDAEVGSLHELEPILRRWSE